jgi:uncharacterized protein
MVITFDDNAEVPEPVRRKHALAETRNVLAKASQTYRPWSCPSSAECCQLAKTGRPPWLWPSEWELLLERLKRDKRTLPPVRSDGGCPFLDASGRNCTVYEDRPFGCRTYFCHRVQGPSAQPTFVTNDLLRQMAGANIEWQDDAEPKSLPVWHEAELAEQS